MNNSELLINENVIRRERNKLIFLSSIFPINLGIGNILGNVSRLIFHGERHETVLDLFIRFSIICLVAIILEFACYKVMKKKAGRKHLNTYNYCFIVIHVWLVIFTVCIWNLKW